MKFMLIFLNWLPSRKRTFGVRRANVNNCPARRDDRSHYD